MKIVSLSPQSGSPKQASHGLPPGHQRLSEIVTVLKRDLSNPSSTTRTTHLETLRGILALFGKVDCDQLQANTGGSSNTIALLVTDSTLWARQAPSLTDIDFPFLQHLHDHTTIIVEGVRLYYWNCAQSWAQQGQPAVAFRNYQGSLDYSFLLTRADTHYQIGLLEIQLGHYALAMEALRSAILENPEDSRYHLKMGQVFLALGRKQDAAGAFSQAHNLAPSDADTYTLLQQTRDALTIRQRHLISQPSWVKFLLETWEQVLNWLD